MHRTDELARFLGADLILRGRRAGHLTLALRFQLTLDTHLRHGNQNVVHDMLNTHQDATLRPEGEIDVLASGREGFNLLRIGDLHGHTPRLAHMERENHAIAVRHRLAGHLKV